TQDVYLRIIDFIEDVSVERYISHTSPEIFENIRTLYSKFIQQIQSTLSESTPGHVLKIVGFDHDEKIENMRTNLLAQPNDVIYFADLLYENRNFCLKIICNIMSCIIQYDYCKQKEKVPILNRLECSKKMLRH